MNTKAKQLLEDLEAVLACANARTFELMFLRIVSSKYEKIRFMSHCLEESAGGLWRNDLEYMIKVIDVDPFIHDGGFDNSMFKVHLQGIKSQIEAQPLSPDSLYLMVNNFAPSYRDDSTGLYRLPLGRDLPSQSR